MRVLKFIKMYMNFNQITTHKNVLPMKPELGGFLRMGRLPTKVCKLCQRRHTECGSIRNALEFG